MPKVTGSEWERRDRTPAVPFHGPNFIFLYALEIVLDGASMGGQESEKQVIAQIHHFSVIFPSSVTDVFPSLAKVLIKLNIGYFESASYKSQYVLQNIVIYTN